MSSDKLDRLVWPPVPKIQVSPSALLTEATNHLKAQLRVQGRDFKSINYRKVGVVPLTYLYCFPPTSKSFAPAEQIHKHFEEHGLGQELKLTRTVGYSCCLATVRDLRSLDPQKQIVKGWAVMITSQDGTPVAAAEPTPNAEEVISTVEGGIDSTSKLVSLNFRTDTEIDLCVSKIVADNQSADSLRKMQANGRLKFMAEIKRCEAVRQAQAMDIITDYTKPQYCSNGDETLIALAKECGDRMRFLTTLIRTDKREVFVNVAETLLEEESRNMMMIEDKSSNNNAKVQALYSEEHELREKYNAYRADDHRRMIEFLSEFRLQSTTDDSISCLTEPSRTMEQLAAARKATLDLKSVLSVEAAMPTLQKDLKSYESKVDELSDELNEAKSARNLFECAICCVELEGATAREKKEARLDEDPQVVSPEKPRPRACFLPCFHASICLQCALRVWGDTQKCPFCNVQLTKPPSAIYF